MRKVFLIKCKTDDIYFRDKWARRFGSIEKARLYNRKSDATCSLNTNRFLRRESSDYEVVEGRVVLPGSTLVFAVQYEVDINSGSVNGKGLIESEVVRGS